MTDTGKDPDQQHQCRQLIHDLRGPLTGIVGSAELILTTQDPVKTHRLASRILAAASTLESRLQAAYDDKR